MLKCNKPVTASLALLILLGSVLSGLCFVSAQSSNGHPLQWEQYYGDGYIGDTVRCLIQTSDGGYAFATPNTHYSILRIPLSILLFKINSLGIVEWQKQFNGSATGSATVAGLVQTSDGGYVFAGDTGDILSGTELIKLDSNGNIQWNRTFPYAGYSSSMVQTRDGGFALAGRADKYLTQGSLANIWFIKTDSAGEVQWNITFQEKLGGGEGGLSQVIQTADGNYAIVGYTYSENASVISTDAANLVMLKFNSLGSILWSKTYDVGISNWGFKSIIQTSDGGYVLTDNTGSSGTPTAIKTDENGVVQWTKNYNNTSEKNHIISTSGSLNSVILTSDGGLAFAGESNFGQIWVIKTDASGNVQWNQTYGDRDQYGYSGTCLIEPNDGSILLGGDWQYRSSSIHYYLTKIQSSLPLPTPSPSPLLPSPSPTLVSTPLETNVFLFAVLVIILSAVIVGLIIFSRKKK